MIYNIAQLSADQLRALQSFESDLRPRFGAIEDQRLPYLPTGPGQIDGCPGQTTGV